MRANSISEKLFIYTDSLSLKLFFSLIFRSNKKKVFLLNSINYREGRSTKSTKIESIFNKTVSNLEIIKVPNISTIRSDQDIYRYANKKLLSFLESKEFEETIEVTFNFLIKEINNKAILIALKKLYMEELFQKILFEEGLGELIREDIRLNSIFIRNKNYFNLPNLFPKINQNRDLLVTSWITSAYDFIKVCSFIITSPLYLREIYLRGVKIRRPIKKNFNTAIQIVWGIEDDNKDFNARSIDDTELFNESQLDLRENLFLTGHKFGRKETKGYLKRFDHKISELESHSLDESRLAIPLDILFKDFLYVGILKIMFLFIISIFKINPLSILEVKIINRIMLCYLSEKVLSAYAEIKVIVSRDDYNFHHVIRTVHQNMIGLNNIGIQHSALALPEHMPDQAHTYFDGYYVNGPSFQELWAPYWDTNKKIKVVGPQRDHCIEKAKKDEILRNKFRKKYTHKKNILVLISPPSEVVSPEWLLKESYNGIWELADLSDEYHLIIRPRTKQTIEIFCNYFPELSNYIKQKKISVELIDFTTQELVAYSDILITEDGSGCLIESAYQEHIYITTMAIRTPVFEDLKEISFSNIKELRNHLRDFINGTVDNNTIKKIQEKYSLPPDQSSWKRIGHDIAENFINREKI